MQQFSVPHLTVEVGEWAGGNVTKTALLWVGVACWWAWHVVSMREKKGCTHVCTSVCGCRQYTVTMET